MPDETTTETTAQTTSDATAQNTDTQSQSGAGTDTAQQTQATQTIDVTQTPEFKTALTAAIEKKIPQIRKQIAKEVSGEKEGGATIEDLTRQLSERDQKLRSYEARNSIRDYLTDARHKLSVHADDLPTIEELVTNRLEYDEEGKPTNLKEAIEAVKARSPKLFANTPVSINAGAGRNGAVPGSDMNSRIRHMAGYGS